MYVPEKSIRVLTIELVIMIFVYFQLPEDVNQNNWRDLESRNQESMQHIRHWQNHFCLNKDKTKQNITKIRLALKSYNFIHYHNLFSSYAAF